MGFAISGGAADGPQHLAAIDGDGLAGDPGGERRGEERHHLRHLVWPAEPAERDAAQDGAVERRVGRLAALPGAAGKLDRSRRRAVDPDAFLGQAGGLGERVFNQRRLWHFPIMEAVAAAAQCHRAAVTDRDACFNQSDNALSSSS